MRFIRSLFQPSLADRKRKELHQAQVGLAHCQTQAEYYANMVTYYRNIARRLQGELQNDKEVSRGTDK